MKNITTYLADSRIHLPLYDFLVSAEGNLDGLQVLSLESFLKRKINAPIQDYLVLLFQYRQKLQELMAHEENRNNLFKDSINDYDFLMSLLRFMELMQAWQINEFPADENNQKEKDLRVILEALNDIDLWQRHAARLELDPEEDVRIVSAFNSLSQQAFTRMINDHQPDLKSSNEPSKKYYWSAANIRKVMQVAAREILEKGYDANDIQIVLANPEDRYVLEQIFSIHEIPFTFLESPAPSRVIEKFSAAFDYIIDPGQESLIRLLKKLYPESSVLLVDYLELFENQSHLQTLPYQPNKLISQEDFDSLKTLEAQAHAWNGELKKMADWKINPESIARIALAIQEQISDPTEEDVKAMDAVLAAYSKAQDWIRTREDLVLFNRYIKTLRPQAAVENVKGVLVGPKETLTNIGELRKIVFYLGASAQNYPGSVVQSGLFDEAYLAKIDDLPDLASRLELQRTTLEKTLDQSEFLYCIIAQSDYQGKSIESSEDLNQYMNQLPQFQPLEDPDVSTAPDFSLKSEVYSSYFNKDGEFSYKVRQLESFESCPLQHFLRYGIGIRSKRTQKDYLRPQASLLEDVIEEHQRRNIPLSMATAQGIKVILKPQFDFVREIFPARNGQIDLIEMETARKMENVLHNLSTLEEDHLRFISQPVSLEIKNEEENFSVNGPLSTTSKARWSVTLGDEDEMMNPLEEPSIENSKGSMNIPLRARPIKDSAFKLKRSGKNAYKVLSTSPQDREKEYQASFLKDSFIAKNYESKEPTLESKKIKSYQEYQKKYSDLAGQVNQALTKDKVSALHEEGSCKRCAYRPICRNGSVVKEK